VSALLQDVRYALRSLARVPGFTLVALITLALGIGGTTAIFSVVDGILLRPLPYPEPAALVSLSRTRQANDSFSPADFLDYKRDTRTFAAVAGYREDIVDMTGGAEPVRLSTLETTGAFFDAFGLPPLMGRVYTERGDRPEGPRVVVVSEGMWRQHLGADANVVGRTVRLNRIPFTVIGVMPAAFIHPQEVDMWTLAVREVPSSPVPIEGDPLADREVQYFQAVARLRPGVSVEQANDDLRRIGDRLAREHPDTNEGEFAVVTPYQESLVGGVRNALLVLFGAVAFVLLIACTNVASLLLARGASRRRELALRTALGAGRGRLIRQLLTESLVLATAGGALGLLLANWGVAGLLALAPDSIPRLAEVRLDPRVAAFGVAASAVVGLLFGIVPAIHGSRSDVTDALKDGGRTGTARTGAQKALVVVEVALALVLLIGAGLMLTSFARLRAVDTGYRVENVVIAFVPLPQARYNNEAQAQFYAQLHERLRANSLTAQSAIVFPTPFGGGNASGGYTVEGAPPQSRSERTIAQINSITPGYFTTMGIQLLKGRDVSERDGDDARVAIVNQTMAEREWPNQDPIGRRISIGNADDAKSWLTVIGVVTDSKRSDLQAAQQPAVYLSYKAFTLPFMGVVVRSEAGEAAVTGAVRAAVRSIDPELPIDDVETLDSVLQKATGQPRFRAFLIAAFAVVALVLAAVGLYGLISYTVAQRGAEIGVRLALGATPGQVGRLVLQQGLGLATVGVGVGLAGAFAATRLLEGLLFSISATDPLVYAGLSALLLAIAAVACYLPARRAMHVDPMAALRAE
jgi:putative ABC transport system permease protein